jgi:hypothetical protein
MSMRHAYEGCRAVRWHHRTGVAPAAGRQQQYLRDVSRRRWIRSHNPLPHLLANGLRSVLLFHAGLDPGRPGSPWSNRHATVRRLSWLVFEGVAHVSLGGPNDEALHSHPLHAAGLRHYQAHEVHNSDVIAVDGLIMKGDDEVPQRPEPLGSVVGVNAVAALHLVRMVWAMAAAALRTGEFTAPERRA